MSNLIITACLLLLALSLGAAVITPPGQYAIKLTWDSPATSWSVNVRTNATSIPLWIISTTNRPTWVSNLNYGVSYFLSVSDGILTSTNLVWPPPLTNYVSTVEQSSGSTLGPWVSVPSSALTLVNPTNPSQYWRLMIWKSNNWEGFMLQQ